MSGKSSIPGFLGAALGAILKSATDGECDCPNCRKTEYTSVVLTGDAAKVVTDFDALYATNRAKIAELEAEILASSKTMWATVQAATGTQDIDEGLQIDSDHASAGFIFLRVPVMKADDATDEGAGQTAADAAAVDNDFAEDSDFAEVEPAPSITPINEPAVEEPVAA